MAFQQVTVENRVSEFPNRRTLTKEDNTTEIVTVTRNEGNVSTEGTAWGAAYANDLESRINTETNLLETNFGHVETNTTASKPYSVGETLVLNGQMYKVTAAIAQGATLTVGNNIAVHSVSAINSNMALIKTYVGTDNRLHSVDSTGADSVLNFKSYYDLGTVSGSHNFDLKTLFPTFYDKLTADNFTIGGLNFAYSLPQRSYHSAYFQKSITSDVLSTKVMITGANAGDTSIYTFTPDYKVYMIYPL